MLLAAQVTLWRRDLLSGVVELDEGLVVRRASPMTGLIVGVPAGAMMRKPIQKYVLAYVRLGQITDTC